MFPDVAERLALGHLAKGDSMSALITGELAAGAARERGGCLLDPRCCTACC
jgi:hypothetical protein